MLGIGPTPFDVRLVAFRIPIRIHPSFWIAMALFGWHPDRLELTFIWVMCTFVSVLVHELGHAFTAEVFDWPTEILLYFGGGLAISAHYRNDTPGRNIAVSIMGPVAGFLLFGIVICLEQVLVANRMPPRGYWEYVFWYLEFINLYWGLVNLLPILPLDGGQIFRSLFRGLRLRDPEGLAMKLSIVVAGLAAYYFLDRTKQQFAGIMMLMLCVQNFFALQSRR